MIAWLPSTNWKRSGSRQSHGASGSRQQVVETGGGSLGPASPASLIALLSPLSETAPSVTEVSAATVSAEESADESRTDESSTPRTQVLVVGSQK